MAGWVCADCTTVYTVDAPRCPHCHSTDHGVQGEPMPKITRNGGPTIAVGGIAVAGSWGDEPPETAGAVEPPASTAPAPDDGGASSPGSSSSASSKTSAPSGEPTGTATPSPARKTASRSKKAPTADSSAPSTDGDPTDDTSDADKV
jgi:hypothetical protein